MIHVLRVIDERKALLEDHPLHRWLVTWDDGGPPERRLWFSLYFLNFIMYFRELNLYHISYASPGRDNGLGEPAQRAAITRHAEEDMTHSRLFLRDFRTLGWDTMLGWRPSEVFHWLFSSRITADLRSRTSAITKLVIEAQDPVVRFAVVEAIEACGNALFRHTNEIAVEYARRTGRELVYWGPYHLARETGHAVDDDSFESAVLDPARRAAAIAKAVRVFELIDEQNSDMLRLAQETLSQGGFGYRRGRHASAPATIGSRPGPEVFDFPFWPEHPHPTQQAIKDLQDKSVAAVRESADLSYFEDVPDLTEAIRRLRIALLFMATDTTGAPTVYRRMISYPIPVSAPQRAINRLCRRFGRRSGLLYEDWRSLRLDDLLDWPVSRTLEFIYLSKDTAEHRDLRGVITHQIDHTLDPLLRYWVIVALKGLTAPVSDAIGALARRVESETGLPLPYLAQRLPVQPLELEPDPEADALRFESLAAGPDLAAQAMGAIDEMRDGILRRTSHMIKQGGRWL
ncbi:hypothetical protein [Nonomuraea jiangxiensis]|uniref:Uncharacterized protein n=1 Tax=Nonomuraea jiangxiensis TaxID=633440 RepID=A0A1G8I897_9ACTN|nr:hypothetical protein [Nonomuraea jiangxiensis]SDI15062.1 hypothetical protein SAMN05421869_104406 [Nonomuraea jiangxiensis]